MVLYNHPRLTTIHIIALWADILAVSATKEVPHTVFAPELVHSPIVRRPLHRCTCWPRQQAAENSTDVPAPEVLEQPLLILPLFCSA